MRAVIIILLISLGTVVSAQEYNLDKKNSGLQWKGYAEIGGFSQEGSIDAGKGQIVIEEGKIVSGTIEINMKSIDSNEKDLTKHLKEKDFFDVKNHPVSTIDLLSIEDGVMLASVTIKGISHELSIPFTLFDEANQVKVVGSALIDRTLFDIKYNSSSYFQDLGNYAIKNEFDLEFQLLFEK